MLEIREKGEKIAKGQKKIRKQLQFRKNKKSSFSRLRRSYFQFVGPLFVIPWGIEGWAFTPYPIHAPKIKIW
jgi:hypothetical protein